VKDTVAHLLLEACRQLLVLLDEHRLDVSEPDNSTAAMHQMSHQLDDGTCTPGYY
jgi:hypothetical protein